MANDKAASLRLLPRLSKITGRFCYMDRLTARNCDTEQQKKFSGHVYNRSANTRARKPSLPRGTRPQRAFVCSFRLTIPEQKKRPPPVYSLRSNVFCFLQVDVCAHAGCSSSCHVHGWVKARENLTYIRGWETLRGVSRSYESQYRG